jgi:hypothetical protein
VRLPRTTANYHAQAYQHDSPPVVDAGSSSRPEEELLPDHGNLWSGIDDDPTNQNERVEDEGARQSISEFELAILQLGHFLTINNISEKKSESLLTIIKTLMTLAENTGEEKWASSLLPTTKKDIWNMAKGYGDGVTEPKPFYVCQTVTHCKCLNDAATRCIFCDRSYDNCPNEIIVCFYNPFAERLRRDVQVRYCYILYYLRILCSATPSWLTGTIDKAG